LGQQGVNHFICDFHQWYIPLDDTVVNGVQSLEAGKNKKSNQNRQGSIEEVSEEHFLGDIQPKKVDRPALHDKFPNSPWQNP
jgi:hypothetical protein